MQEAEQKLQTILQKYKSVDRDQVNKLDVVQKLKGCQFFNYKSGTFRLNVLIVVVAVMLCGKIDLSLLDNPDCFLEMPSMLGVAFRPPEACDICEDVYKVDKLETISPDEFYWNYAKISKPVVVKDGATHWPALKMFNFTFFKQIYESVDRKRIKKGCQFFPYKTEFRHLKEVFNMSAARANLEKGEKNWYIGFNNCNDEAGKILRRYYDKPYFLTGNSDNMALSWIFMGGPGHGAHMHVDNVRYPSWQAQLSGRKSWRLAPPPECYYKCREMSVVVEPGEVIALDTNRWYHQTDVMAGDISITIGSEFY